MQAITGSTHPIHFTSFARLKFSSSRNILAGMPIATMLSSFWFSLFAHEGLSVALPDESMAQRDDFMKHIIRKCADSRLGDHRKYSDVGDKVLIPNRRKATIEMRYSIYRA